MDNAKTALLAGATGLIGSQLLPLLAAQPRYKKILVIGRKDTKPGDAKIENLTVNFDHLHEYSALLKADDVFCCLGSTIRKAKTREEFRKVDYQYALNLAKISKALGAQQYFLVSAHGANRKSAIFYNRVKGETEDAISSVGFYALHLYRPSFLLGTRAEKRPGEEVAKILFRVFGFLLPKRLRAINAGKVARAMVTQAEKEERGIFFHESGDLQAY